VKQDNYKTKDIFEAAWIYSNNVPLITLEPDSKYSWFVFANKEVCLELSAKYWSNSATGNIKSFVSSLKTLKDFIFSRG
jgi:hypothetical protein